MLPALLIIDLQDGPLDEHPELRPVADRILAHAREHAQDYGVVVATGFRNDPGSSYDRLVGDDLRHPSEVAIWEPLREVAGLVVESPTYSSLTPRVQQQLVHCGAREVHVIGIDTDQCVLATVFALFDAGYEPRVFDDLVASASGSTPHEAGLVALRRAIGEDRVHPASEATFDSDRSTNDQRSD